jgi:hypothetical protein
MSDAPQVVANSARAISVSGRAGRRRYLDFRRKLYTGDSGYSTTAEFAVESVLDGSSAFTRSCFRRPLLIEQDGQILAQCILIEAPDLPALQVSFFEALPDQPIAVELLLAEARAVARDRNLDTIIVGLNAHLSIGVGILTDGFTRATFDSSWNKPYYADYFAGLERRGLTSYTGTVPEVLNRVASASRATTDAPGAVSIRKLNPAAWNKEMEVFRSLCDATLGTTPLYAPTQPGHFADLLGELRPFLRPENLLFATVDGRDVGFCFWHPDYNELLPTGRQLSTAAVAWRFATRRSQASTVVLNAIGVLDSHRGVATSALLAEVAKAIDGRFVRYETSFIWDANDPSIGLCRYLEGQPVRRYSVWLDHL